jgi:hypothetical protein
MTSVLRGLFVCKKEEITEDKDSNKTQRFQHVHWIICNSVYR